MEIMYNRTGKERKELVMAIAEITGAEAIYKGVPTCNYEVDYFTINKNGTLSFDDSADSEEVEQLIEALLERGFEAEVIDESFETQAGLAVCIPLEKVKVENLTHLLDAKGDLIRKALGIEDLQFTVDPEKVTFPWFKKVVPEEAMTYSRFISKICEMTVNQKKITAKAKENDNEKYAFRCFLLRLGFIGEEYKADRKILLKNLSGSSAFKGGTK